MSALDDIITLYNSGQSATPMNRKDMQRVIDARADLSQLRARIDALENDIVCAFCGTHYKADDVPPQHYLTCEKSPLVQRIAEQARQLAEAANIMATVSLEADPEIANPTVRRYAIDMCDSWLAANHAPQEEQDEAQ